MARKPFVVLDAEILSSSVWSESAHVRLVWITLLILCDTEGYVGAALPGIARAAGVSLEQATEAMDRLQQPDPHSRTKDNEGRRLALAERGYQVLNFRQHLDRLSSERVKARDRVRRFRERRRNACNVTVPTGSREQGVVRSDAPASGSTPVALVPVKASVTGASASPLAKPVKPGRETWLTGFAADWREAYEGEPSFGEMARVLRQPVEALGEPEVRRRWRLYLGQTEGRFASPTRFAQTIGVWTEEAIARCKPADIRSMTVGQFNAATYERVLARMNAREAENAGQGALAAGSTGFGRLLPGEDERA